jgi:hypothetical protein
MTTAAEMILAELTALGARIECRGERLVLCPGRRTVPKPLVEAARASKPGLLALLGASPIAEGAAAASKSAKITVVGALNADPQKTARNPPISAKDASNKNFGALWRGDEAVAGRPEAGETPNLGVQASPRSAAFWRDLFEERAAIREGGYSRAEAEPLAWGELQNRWHLAHGERVPRHLCAGCRRPIIGAAPTLDLIDGNRVHDAAEHDCLIRWGERWRAAASRGLIAIGLSPLAGWESSR